jgi:hypothetical protein
MAGSRNFIWVIVALTAPPGTAAAAPGSAPASDPCPVIERLLASARETPAFASAQRALARGEAIVPGFDASDCRVNPGTSFDCSDWGMGSHGVPRWTEPVTCASLTLITLPPRHFNWARAFAAPDGLRVEYGVRCRGCAGPATSYFSVSFEGGRRPEE